jgi:hypothetical protein
VWSLKRPGLPVSKRSKRTKGDKSKAALLNDEIENTLDDLGEGSNKKKLDKLIKENGSEDDILLKLNSLYKQKLSLL